MQKKMIVVCQKDVKDCGPCALQSIIRYYGGYVSLEKIRQDTYTSLEGTTVYHLTKAAEKYGFDALAKKYLDNCLSKIILPAIVHVHYENGLNHFMCLYKIEEENIILMDPAKGKVKMDKQSFLKIFTGVVIELSPKRKIVYLEKESNIYKLFLNIIKDNQKLVINLLLCSIFLTIFTIISGFYFKIAYEALQQKTYISNLNYIIYLFLIFIILKVVFTFFKNYYENHLNKNIDVNVIGNFIKHIFNLPLKVIYSRSTGEITSRINELNSIKELFSQIFISSVLDVILAFGSLIILFYINSVLALILCLIILFYIIFSLILNPYLYKRINQNIDFQTEFNSGMIENIDMLNSLKNLNSIHFAQKRNEIKLSKLIFDNYDFMSFFNFCNTLRNCITEIGIFIINTYAFYLISLNKIELVDLVLFNTIMFYFIDPIKNIISLIPKYNFLRASFRRICDFIDLKEEKYGKKEKFINGDIIFQNVAFSYNGYYKNINNLNLKIRQSEKVMIKGKSGSGKSTICNLLERMYEPDSGKILIGNKNISDYSLSTIRESITYVGQKEKLYSDTIKNNIFLGKECTKDFDKVCSICLIEDIVNKKKFRYDFGIDNNTTNLSGGEKQRIILARALLKNSKILILDEALSELDFNLEKQIIKNLLNNFPDKTIIYVTHKKHDNLFKKIINFEEVNSVDRL